MRTGKMQEYDNDGNECLDSMDQLVGKTIRAVDLEGGRYDGIQTVVIVCEDCAFETAHSQDCCEYVRVYDMIGDPKSLIGQKVTNCYFIESDKWPDDIKQGTIDEMFVDSFTWTTQIIQTESTEVKIRWLGESNGWYSEGIYFRRIAVPLQYLGE